jgi:hypothetical protein
MVVPVFRLLPPLRLELYGKVGTGRPVSPPPSAGTASTTAQCAANHPI